MDNTAITCACGSTGFMLHDSVTVPAGSVNGGLSVCGYDSPRERLPITHILNQEYTEGFCPDTALAVGTLFPELTGIYK